MALPKFVLECSFPQGGSERAVVAFELLGWSIQSNNGVEVVATATPDELPGDSLDIWVQIMEWSLATIIFNSKGVWEGDLEVI